MFPVFILVELFEKNSSSGSIIGIFDLFYIFKSPWPYSGWVFLGLLMDRGPKRSLLLKICHTYPTMMKLGTVIPYLKKIQKTHKSHDTPLESADISILHRKSADFSVSRNTDIDCILKQFLTLSTVFESLKIVLINMVTILMMSTKIATLGLLEIWVFWNKGYDVIIFAHIVTSKKLSRDSNCFVDVVMWPKFVNSSIYIREVIITSIL